MTITTEAIEASRKLLEAWDAYRASSGNMEEAYYKLAKYAWNDWEALRAALSVPAAAVVGEPVAWHRCKSFMHHFVLGSERPQNNTSNPNEWTPLYAAPSAPDGWQPIETAPRDKTSVIIAVPTKDYDGHIVGEAYFDPDHYEDGDWWWANTDRGDYHGGPISEINFHGPSRWQPLPAPPALGDKP